MLSDKEIKELIRDPKLYYILVPLVCALWPLWVGLVALPSAQKTWEDEKDSYTQAEKIIANIYKLDPERFAGDPNQGKAAVFSYPAAINQVAGSCGIPAPDVVLGVSGVMKAKEGQQTQDAHVTLKQVNIATFAKFLSTMQLRWADVQCTSLKLTKEKGAPDLWKADMTLKYYF
jgi:hypothetical protein